MLPAGHWEQVLSFTQLTNQTNELYTHLLKVIWAGARLPVKELDELTEVAYQIILLTGEEFKVIFSKFFCFKPILMRLCAFPKWHDVCWRGILFAFLILKRIYATTNL